MTTSPAIQTVLRSGADWDAWKQDVETFAKSRGVKLSSRFDTGQDPSPCPPQIEAFTQEYRTITGELDLPLMHYNLALYRAQVKDWEIKDAAYRREHQARKEVFLAMMRSLPPKVVRDLDVYNLDAESCDMLYRILGKRFEEYVHDNSAYIRYRMGRNFLQSHE